MSNYNRDRSSNNRNSGGGGDFSRSEMHDAVCAECGRNCKVPFRPTGDKPIYCSNCFEHQSGKRSGGRDNRRRDYQEVRMHTATCDECGNECEVPFKPTSGKPVFCNDCFKGTGRSSKGRGGDRDDKGLQKQIDVINSKLDRIIQALESSNIVEKEPKKKSSAKKTVSKKKKATKKKAKKTVKKKTKKATPKKK